jgi:hypothetical protein
MSGFADIPRLVDDPSAVPSTRFDRREPRRPSGDFFTTVKAFLSLLSSLIGWPLTTRRILDVRGGIRAWLRSRDMETSSSTRRAWRINPRHSSWLDPRLTRAVECHPGHGTLANPGRRPDDEIEEGVPRRCEWVGR